MEEDEDIDVGGRTWRRAAQPIQQDAFREGFEEGRQGSFQAGFDEGFARGFSRGFGLGFVNGALRADTELSTRKIQLQAYDSAHRGKCAICPSTNSPITKDQSAKSSLMFKSVVEIIEKENIDDFIVTNFKSVNRLLGDCDK
ncbi:Hypothetical protein NTJ_06722 [Nesidiocoris tenuis]|uniref:Essential protein Yae1 N-terminal domain-containing protein n=1 Tax=Nesidiocoris tenuis TaxID=355587 RepID=A0ABN7ANV9_9HEMI|nr:Hypothetical protein NTJ_06722 [Nesidiocoris tenuis]